MAKEPVTADAAPKKGGGVMRLLKLLLGSAVLVGAGFGGGYFYFANPLSPAQDMLQLDTHKFLVALEFASQLRVQVQPT